MPHFYIKPENINGEFFTADEDAAHYIFSVRRFEKGDEIMIFDGKGNSYKAQIISSSKKEIKGKIISFSYCTPKKTIKLFTAVPKGERFEWLIEKAGELGVSEIIPLNTQRSITNSFSENKVERYKKISISASSQCGRNDIMKISEFVDFKTACLNAAENKNHLNIIPWESEEKKTIWNISHNKSFPGANIFIGPEGGFSREEINFASELGINAVTLGKNILRVETAAVSACVLVLTALGDN